MIRYLASYCAATMLVLVAFNGFGTTIAPKTNLKIIATVYAHSHQQQHDEPFVMRLAGR